MHTHAFSQTVRGNLWPLMASSQQRPKTAAKKMKKPEMIEKFGIPVTYLNPSNLEPSDRRSKIGGNSDLLLWKQNESNTANFFL